MKEKKYKINITPQQRETAIICCRQGKIYYENQLCEKDNKIAEKYIKQRLRDISKIERILKEARP